MSQSLRQLIRKIHLSLEGELPRAELVLIAEEFSQICHQTNERLDQLATLIERESYYTALQLAESEPAVIDTVALLSFAQIEQWRALCAEQRLMVSERLNESAIRQVQSLYSGKHIDTAYLYREYRSSILQRNISSAVRSLRAILRINAEDKNAREELNRLQARQHQTVWKELEEALQKKDQENILLLLEEIEGSPYTVSEDNVLWKQALVYKNKADRLRGIQLAKELREKIQEASQNEEWKQVLQYQKSWDQSIIAGGVEIKDSIRDEIDQLLSKANKEYALIEEKERQERIAQEWYGFIDEVGSKLQVGAINPNESKEGLGRLSEFRRELLLAGASPSDELDADSVAIEKKLSRILNRARHKKGMLIGAGILAAMLIFVVGSLFYVYSSQKKEFIREATEALLNKDFNQAKQLARYVGGKSARFKRDSEIASLSTEINQWIEKESNYEVQVEALYRRAQSLLTLGKSQIPSIYSTLKEAEEMSKVLLPASRDNLRVLQQEVTLAWERNKEAWVKEDRIELEELTHKFSQLWKQYFEDINMPDDYSSEITAGKEFIERAEQILKRLQSLELEELATIEFWDEAQAKLGLVADQLAQYQRGIQLLKENESLESFEYGISLLKGLSFERNRWVQAANQVVKSEVQWANPSKALLQIAGEKEAKSLSKGGGTRFAPVKLNSSENLQLRTLLEQSIASKLYQYNLFDYKSGRLQSGNEVIYALGKIKTKSTPRGDRAEVAQVVQRVTASTLEKSPYYEETVYMATKRLVDESWRDGNALSNEKRIPEADFLETLKKEIGYNGENGAVEHSILRALDLIVSSDEIDPVFRAWVYGELIQVAMNRPEEWGVFVTPALLHDWERLQRLCEGVPTLADWLDSNRAARIRPLAQIFFKNPSVPSYVKQATFQVQLANILGGSTWSYYGYSDFSGEIILAKQPAHKARYLWGREALGEQWAPLYEDRGGSWIKQGNPQPLTPLFAFSKDLGEMVILAGERTGNLSDEELQKLREFLPPYFQ